MFVHEDILYRPVGIQSNTHVSSCRVLHTLEGLIYLSKTKIMKAEVERIALTMCRLP